MPHKGRNYDFDLVRGGGADFVLDDLYITNHALERLKERGLPWESLRKRTGGGKPVLKGSTVVTVVADRDMPRAIKGLPVKPPRARLFSTRTRPVSTDLECGEYAGLVIGEQGRSIDRLEETFHVTASIADGRLRLTGTGPESNVQGALVRVKERIAGARPHHIPPEPVTSAPRRPRSVSPASVRSATGPSGDSLTFVAPCASSAVDCRGVEAHVVGFKRRNIDRLGARYHVAATVDRSTGILHLRATDHPECNVEGAAEDAKALVAKIRESNEATQATETTSASAPVELTAEPAGHLTPRSSTASVAIKCGDVYPHVMGKGGRNIQRLRDRYRVSARVVERRVLHLRATADPQSDIEGAAADARAWIAKARRIDANKAATRAQAASRLHLADAAAAAAAGGGIAAAGAGSS